MKISKIMGIMEKEFEDIISTKNSWGKNEIMRVFNSAQNKTLIKLFDETNIKDIDNE